MIKKRTTVYIEEKLAKLKALAAQKRAEEEAAKTATSETLKEEEMPPRIVEDRKRSLRFGILGSGQAGSRRCIGFSLKKIGASGSHQSRESFGRYPLICCPLAFSLFNQAPAGFDCIFKKQQALHPFLTDF